MALKRTLPYAARTRTHGLMPDPSCFPGFSFSVPLLLFAGLSTRESAGLVAPRVSLKSEVCSECPPTSPLWRRGQLPQGGSALQRRGHGRRRTGRLNEWPALFRHRAPATWPCCRTAATRSGTTRSSRGSSSSKVTGGFTRSADCSRSISTKPSGSRSKRLQRNSSGD